MVAQRTALYSNIRNFLNKGDEMEMLAVKALPVVVALTETWLMKDISDSGAALPR